MTGYVQNQALIRTKATRHLKGIDEVARAADRQGDRLVADTADIDRKFEPRRPVTRKLHENVGPQPSAEDEFGTFRHRRARGL
jgi:hypothetical protein